MCVLAAGGSTLSPLKPESPIVRTGGRRLKWGCFVNGAEWGEFLCLFLFCFSKSPFKCAPLTRNKTFLVCAQFVCDKGSKRIM